MISKLPIIHNNIMQKIIVIDYKEGSINIHKYSDLSLYGYEDVEEFLTQECDYSMDNVYFMVTDDLIINTK